MISQIITKGTTPRGGNVAYVDNGIGFLRAENVSGFGKLDTRDLKYVTEDVHNNFLKRSILCANDILITIAGTLGRTAIVPEDKLPLNTNQAVSIVRPVNPELLNLMYIIYAINSTEVSKKLLSQSVEMAIPNLSLENISNCILPLPPFQEQIRIVAYIEKILENVEGIESYKENLTTLVSITKSKILDLAIRGKLVPQNQDDEPASVLLERIKAQKEELINQGKIKRDKKESIIFKGDDNSYYRSTSGNVELCTDLPFELPNGWEWCNLSMIGYTNIGLTYKPTDIVSDGTMVLRSSNIVNGKIDLTDLVRVNTNIRDNQYIEENDILICARNGSKALVGKCAIFEGISERTSFGAFMAVYRSEFYKYIYYFLNSQIFRDTFMNDDTKQINQLTQDMIKNTILALPPFEEQKRIVDAIETVFEQLDNILNSI